MAKSLYAFPKSDPWEGNNIWLGDSLYGRYVAGTYPWHDHDVWEGLTGTLKA